MVLNDCRNHCAPSWNPTSETVLGRLLTTDSQPAVCEAISLARTLVAIRSALTEKSVPVFWQKVTELFNARSEVQFRELVTELRAAEILASRVSPIAFEPYVPRAEDLTGDQPRSSDYAVMLPEGPIAIEVTVIHVDAFETWRRLVRELVDAMRTRIEGAGRFLAVELLIPFVFDRAKAQVLLQRKTLAPLLREDEGKIEVDVGGPVDAVIRWSALPVVAHQDGLASLPGEAFAAVVGEEGAFGSACAFSYQPAGTPLEAEELAYTSLTRTLQRKKKQLEGRAEPAVLVVASAHHWLPLEGLLDLFERRVWPNPQFSWLTAVGVLVTPDGFTKAAGESGMRLITSINEESVIFLQALPFACCSPGKSLSTCMTESSGTSDARGMVSGWFAWFGRRSVARPRTYGVSERLFAAFQPAASIIG